MQTRGNDFLLSPIERIEGSKLPSRRQVLGHFLFLHIEEKNPIRESSSAVMDRVSDFWQMAAIPTRHKQDSIKAVEKLYSEWQRLKKNCGRRTVRQKAIEEEFLVKLDDLFDIAHANALNMMKIQEDKDFLLAQREKGRRGTMSVVDRELIRKTDQIEMRKEAQKRQRQKEDETIAEMKKTIVLESSSSTSTTASDSENTDDDSDDSVPVDDNEAPCPKRGRKQIITAQLAAALDRNQLSDRAAMMVVTETARSLKQNISELSLNRSSIRNQRRQFRETTAKGIKESLDLQPPLILHWDGKLMMSLTGRQKVERLPVLVSGLGSVQLLAVPQLPKGTGQAQAEAIMHTLRSWEIEQAVRGFCFDTTSVNTGKSNGTCVLLEQMLARDMLQFACRHHIMELLLAAAFDVYFGPTSAPEIQLFKRFQTQWPSLNPTVWQDASTDDMTAMHVLNGSHVETITFLQQQLQHQPRDDYRELIELVLTFLGAHGGWSFKTPGALHQARWMAKAIYAVKLFLFRAQFHLTHREEQGLREICVFISTLYVRAWYEAPLAWKAPLNDLILLKSMCNYPNQKIRYVLVKKLKRHLWYLSEDLAALSLFDDRIAEETKQEMVTALRSKEAEENVTKRGLQLEDSESKTLPDFITKRSMKLFLDLELPTTFLNTHPSSWSARSDYQAAFHVIRNLEVVNDHAERGVALVKEFTGNLTADEEQLQWALQVVAEHRKKFPNVKKATLLELDSDFDVYQ